MRPNKEETYESWSDRVALFEQGRAMMQIAQGRDVEQVMEEMSRRIAEKMLHPIFKGLRDSVVIPQSSDEDYWNQMKKRGPVPDHIDDDIKSLYNK